MGFPISFDIIAFLIFIAIVAIVLFKERKKIQFVGVTFMRRTNRGKAFLDGTARKRPKLWRTVGILSLAAGIGAMIFVIYMLFSCTISVVIAEKSCFKLILPGPAGDASGAPGIPLEKSPVLFLPWYFWVIGIASVVIPHEFFHGIICRLHKIKIKSLGWFILLFIPGAFVEPNQKQLDNAPRRVKMKIYAAGSFANFLMAGLFFVLLMFLIFIQPLLFQPSGLIYSSYIENTPASQANLSGAILSINGMKVTSAEQMMNILSDIPPNSNISLNTTKGVYNLQSIPHPERNGSYIGIRGPYALYYSPNLPIDIFYFMLNLFSWIFMINLGIGLFNMLPIKPLDGGLFFEEIIGKFTRHRRPIIITISLIFVFLIVFNIAGPFFI